jgi:hypothetical protein
VLGRPEPERRPVPEDDVERLRDERAHRDRSSLKQPRSST